MIIFHLVEDIGNQITKIGFFVKLIFFALTLKISVQFGSASLRAVGFYEPEAGLKAVPQAGGFADS